MSIERRRRYHDSLAIHQIRTKASDGFALPVTLQSSDNEYLRYPVDGVIRICEQGTSLTISQAVFHRFNDDGSLGAPVTVRNARFSYAPGLLQIEARS